MSDHADFDVKERVRNANDIVDVVGSYLELRRAGSNYVALCPWHDDNKPSLQVNPARQTWKCWPCDIGGDVFSFIQQYDSVNFGESLKILADRAGIQLRQFQRKPLPAGSPGDKQTLYAAMQWIQKQYFECLAKDPVSADARRYLAARGINENSIQQFGIGYAPDAWHWLREQSHNTPYNNAIFDKCGMLSKSDSGKSFDFFRGRIMFPIHDTQDRVVAFGGRVLPAIVEQAEKEERRPPAKYFNSPETRLFSKSDTLYGLNYFRQAIQKQKHLIIVEGYTDVIGAWQAGFDNVVAVLGTSLNNRHLRLIRRYADKVTLVLDGDQAGIKRANEMLGLFVSADLDLRILTLPEKLDPCDYLEQHGATQFRQLVDSSPDALDHKIAIETTGIDLVNDTHRSNRALENILAVLAQAPNKTSALQVRLEQLLNRMSHLFGLEQSHIRNRLQSIRKLSKRRQGRETAQTPQNKPLTLDWKEKEILQILIGNPEFLDQIIENISPDQFVSGPTREIYELYCECFNAGRNAEFQIILTMADDQQIKNLLVELDDEEQNKQQSTDFDARKRLDDVVRAFEAIDLQASSREAKSRLSQRDMDDREETSTLEELLEQSRRRQGL